MGFAEICISSRVEACVIDHPSGFGWREVRALRKPLSCVYVGIVMVTFFKLCLENITI